MYLFTICCLFGKESFGNIKRRGTGQTCIYYLEGVPQVCSADLRVLSGVKRDRIDPDEGKDAGLRVPPQHHPRTLLRLAAEHHLMGARQSLGGCQRRGIDNNIRIKLLYSGQLSKI